jgi:hypothetical protein
MEDPVPEVPGFVRLMRIAAMVVSQGQKMRSKNV